MRQRPEATGRWDRTANTSSSNHTTIGTPAQLLLARLEGVIPTGKGWRAMCPHCGGKSRKLSIVEGDNGTLLVTCFSCHDTPAVLTAVGLQMGDLFQRRDLRSMSPGERSQLRQAALLPRWRAALDVLTLEAGVVLLAAAAIADGGTLTADELTRLSSAVRRTFDASEVLRAR